MTDSVMLLATTKPENTKLLATELVNAESIHDFTYLFVELSSGFFKNLLREIAADQTLFSAGVWDILGLCIELSAFFSKYLFKISFQKYASTSNRTHFFV